MENLLVEKYKKILNKLVLEQEMNKSKKFKYLPVSFNKYFIEDLKDEYVVDCPLDYNNLPDGEYLIRGEEKYHRNIYIKYKNKWYLTEKNTKQDYKIVDLVKYDLLPRISEKQWNEIKHIPYKCLNKDWKDYRLAYDYWYSMRYNSRELRKRFLNILK